jgi:dTDP-4-amino-4,6-dideoxygalactose transaminase
MASGDPFNFPQQDLHRHGALVADAIERMRASGQLILGEGVKRFEEAFAAWLVQQRTPPTVVGVANGTDALELALRGCGVGSGDRVVMPSHTAYATTAAVLRVGAVPLFADITATGHGIAVDHVRQLLQEPGPRPRALIAVHLYGESCDLASLRSLCDDEGLDLIEDCAQACGTLYRGEPVGTWGRFAAFSFYPTKNLAAFGDGGALVVNRPGDAEAARRSRFYGWDGRRQAVQFGVNSRLDELQAWVLLGKLDHLRSQIADRRQVARWYRERLQPLADNGVVLPADGPDWEHSYHLHVVQVPSEQRDLLLEEGRSMGLPLAVHYPLACHQQPYVIDQFGPQAELPRTEERLGRILSLPLHPYLDEGQIDDVCTSFLALVDRVATGAKLAAAPGAS